MNARVGVEGVAKAFAFDVSAAIRDYGPRQPSALRIEVTPGSMLQTKPPLRARDLESRDFFVTFCVAPGGSLAQATPGAQEAALRRLDQTLPDRLNLQLGELLLPVESGGEYPASHQYTYVRVKDRPSRFSKGCLQPFYRISF